MKVASYFFSDLQDGLKHKNASSPPEKNIHLLIKKNMKIPEAFSFLSFICRYPVLYILIH
jgi:hypothetical protein